jgi:hypothetical protein
MGNEWNKIFNVIEGNFIDLALEIFQFQYRHNSIYRTYVDMLKFNTQKINSLGDIPFLPIRFFKTHTVKTTDFEPAYEFESSGTTQTINSRHFIKDIELYLKSFTKGFELFYGSAEDFEKLHNTLKNLEEKRQKTLLIGVTFALLDFAGECSLPLKHTTIMETGGMKGRREEMIRHELHEVLRKKFKKDVIHSEYGMTELLSQAYSRGNGIFYCPPWMKVLVRDEEDPFEVQSAVGSRQSVSQPRFTIDDSRLTTKGVLNVIDLANVYSCSFIATDDAGKMYSDGSFEVIGRIDNSDIRGCSLMAM